MGGTYSGTGQFPFASVAPSALPARMASSEELLEAILLKFSEAGFGDAIEPEELTRVLQSCTARPVHKAKGNQHQAQKTQGPLLESCSS